MIGASSRKRNSCNKILTKLLRSHSVCRMYFAHSSMLATLPINIGSAARLRSGSLHKTELRQRRHAIVQTDLFNDLAVFEAKHGRAGEAHLPAGRCGRRSDEAVAER